MTHCKSCTQLKPRIFFYTAKSGHRVHVDDKGRQWKGLVCPDCRNAQVKADRKILVDKSSGHK